MPNAWQTVKVLLSLSDLKYLFHYMHLRAVTCNDKKFPQNRGIFCFGGIIYKLITFYKSFDH